jgi:hypothetical protein
MLRLEGRIAYFDIARVAYITQLKERDVKYIKRILYIMHMIDLTISYKNILNFYFVVFHIPKGQDNLVFFSKSYVC